MNTTTKPIMRRWHRDLRGMSVVEVIIAVAVLAMIAGVMGTVFVTAARANWKARNSVQAQQNGRIGLEKLTRDLRQAGRLFHNSGTPFGGFTYIINCSALYPQISFVLPHVQSITLADGTSVWAPDIDSRSTSSSYGKVPYDGWYVSYYLAATNTGTVPNQNGPYLVRRTYNLVTGTSSTQLAAQNASSLVFLVEGTSGTCPSATPAPGTRAIQVTLTSTTLLADQTSVAATVTLTQDVVLRNSWQ